MSMVKGFSNNQKSIYKRALKIVENVNKLKSYLENLVS